MIFFGAYNFSKDEVSSINVGGLTTFLFELKETVKADILVHSSSEQQNNYAWNL